MSSVSQALAMGTNESIGLSHAAHWLRTTYEADSVAILLSSPLGGLELGACVPQADLVGRVKLGRGVGLVGLVADSGETVAVTNGLTTDPRYEPAPLLDEPDYASAVATAIPHGSERFGVVVLRRTAPWPLAAVDAHRIEASAHELGAALHVYRAAFESGSQSNRLGLLAEMTDTLTGTPYLEEILQQLVNLTARRFNYQAVSLRLLDERQQALVLRAAYSVHRAYPKRAVIHQGESIAGRALQLGRPVIVEDVQAEDTFIGHDVAVEQGLRSMVCVPLTLQSRQVGVMSCYTGEVRQFPPDEIATLETLAKQAAISIEHAKLQARDTLLQEMHHRVKNNLQQVASLLRLQLRQGRARSLESALTDTLSRIEAIASVHELLSRDDLDHVSLVSLAEMLVNHQQQSFMLPGKSVAFSVRGEEVYVDTTQATQVALVLNELVQNAVKHGFQNMNVGEVHVTIEDRDATIGLWVSNNGDRLPEAGLDEAGRLGLQIIRGLARSLRGSFTLEDRLGWTVASLSFPRVAEV